MSAARHEQIARNCVRKKDERGEQIVISLDGRKRDRYELFERGGVRTRSWEMPMLSKKKNKQTILHVGAWGRVVTELSSA